MLPRGAAGDDGSSTWVSASHMGDLARAPGFYLAPRWLLQASLPFKQNWKRKKVLQIIFFRGLVGDL